jgi:hypothetical protein
MAALPPEMACVACGQRLPRGSKFCDECGTAQPADPPKKIGSQTVIGVSSPVANIPKAAAEQPQYARASHPGFAPAPPAPTPLAQKKNPLGQTMVGVGALPGADHANAPLAAAPIAPAASAAKNNPKGTLMGVALPGIAPTHEPTPPPQFAPPPPYVPPPPPAPATPSGRFDELPAGVPKSSRAPAIILGLIALLSIAGALVYVFVLRQSGPPPLTSSIEGDSNAPKLAIKCATCPDGSTIDLGSKNATFTGGAATIALAPKDLKVGPNVFKGKLVPKGKSPQDVELDVAIPFLVHPSLAPLEKGESKVDVVFDLADDQKAVVIDGEKLKGKTYELAIPAPSDEARVFDKTLSYEVQPKEGTPMKGSLKLSIPYASLRVGLPGRRPFAIGEELEVSGHTAAGGTVTVNEETTLTADDAGLFKGKVKVAADTKELKLRAFAGKLAPREVTVPIAHAKDAAEVYKILKDEAKTPFAKIAEKPEDNIGAVVSTKITVAQTGEEDGRPIAVGDAKCAEDKCPVVRVLLPPGASAAKGDVLEVLGVVARAVPVEQGKASAVEIDASILIRSK